MSCPEPTRPKKRGDCSGQPGACPFVSCRHHLIHGVMISRGRSVKPILGDEHAALTWLENAVDSGADTCVLDVADRGPQECAAIGRAVGVTKQHGSNLVDAAMLAFRRAGRGLKGEL